MKIEKIDKNFAATKVGNLDIAYHDALEAPFELEGFPWRDPALIFNRLPASFTSKDVNDKALSLSKCTTGGAIRFKTDSTHLALRTVLAHSSDMNHMPRAGSAGFDLYSGCGKNMQHWKAVQPDHGQKDLETLLVADQPAKMTDWTLYLPLYGAASKIEIGVAPGAKIKKPTPHAIARPILFYGSSITQGGCASRPGNAYTTMLCREVDAPQINLGFSGSGKGEPAVAQAIAGLDLAVFVMDYDYNAPTLEHLKKTHANFFKIIRSKKPGLPVIMTSKCNFFGTKSDRDRRDVIRRTYARAVRAGDKRVWLIDGKALFGTEHRDACMVDRCHPNDLGFYRMFRTILPTLVTALQSQNSRQVGRVAATNPVMKPRRAGAKKIKN